MTQIQKIYMLLILIWGKTYLYAVENRKTAGYTPQKFTSGNNKKDVCMENSYQLYKERLDGIFAEYADRDSMIYLRKDGEKTHLTFTELSQKIKCWADAIFTHSIAAGDRVAIIAPSIPNTIVAGLTLAYAHVTAVFLDPSMPKEELNRLLDASDVQGVFATGDFFPVIQNKHIPVFDLDNSDLQLVQFHPQASQQAGLRRIEADPEVIAVIYSSGTTSSAKGVMLTYQSVMLSWEKLSYAFGLKAGVRYFLVLPYNHISGYTSATVFLLSGCALCMMENLTPAKLQTGFQEFAPNYFGMVPKVYDIMANKIREGIRQKGAAAEKLLDFGFCLSGFLRRAFGLKIGKILFKPIYSRALGKNITGLAVLGTICKPETAKLFMDFGIDWANVYAATETNAPITTTGIFDHYPLNSVGRIDRFADIDIQIHNPNEDGVGEIYVKTPLIMKGYFREPELTVDAFENGYFKTGDLGFTDKKGYLYLVGRSKDTIVLHSGKKVSAVDIDGFYQRVCPGFNIASCGVSGPDGFDTIHLFIETQGHSREEVAEACRYIWQQSSGSGALYQITAIHETEKLPFTTVGKIKRFILKEEAEKALNARNEETASPDGSFQVPDTLYSLILSITNGTMAITSDSRLQEDLGLDSLGIAELCLALWEKYGVSVEPYLHQGMTVSEIEALLAQGTSAPLPGGMNFGAYPQTKSEKDMRKLHIFWTVSNMCWKVEVLGRESLRPDEKYIFCPNHESYLDAMWVVGSLDSTAGREMCTMAADILFENRLFRWGLTAMGAIPVQREGNTAPALRCAYECLSTGQHHLLIHPEGTRTRSGQLGTFKPGAAALAIETGLKIIPVCINGAFEIFPPHRKFPRLFDWKRLRRYPLQIHFGQPIAPEGKTAEEITGEIEEQIVAMKQERLL